MRRVDDKFVVHIAMRSGSHSLAHSVELADVGRDQRQSVLVRLIGRSDWMPRQAHLLDEIIAGPLIDNITLTAAGALAAPLTRAERARNASRTNSAQGDFLTDP
jgi:hypothetical protein